MKKERRKISEIFFEIIIELILTIVFVGIGFLIMKLFGSDVSFENVDFELVALIGVVVFLVLFFIIYFIVKGMNNLRK